LEPSGGVQVRTTDGIECDVELGKESEDGNEYDEVRAPDTESSLVRQLVKRTTVGFPVDGQILIRRKIVGYCLPG
jgi:hypothetical protein